MLGMGLGMLLAHITRGHALSVWALFLSLTMFHMYGECSSIVLCTLIPLFVGGHVVIDSSVQLFGETTRGNKSNSFLAFPTLHLLLFRVVLLSSCKAVTSVHDV
jgi:hypothetical protein